MKCKYEGEGRYEGRCYGTKEIDPCPGYDKCSNFKANFTTNADHIRSMRDEELAEIFANFLINTFKLNEIRAELEDSFVADMIEWLKQPYEERNTNSELLEVQNENS